MRKMNTQQSAKHFVRWATQISLVATLLLGVAGCTAKKQGAPIRSSLPITSVPVRIQGQDWHISTIVALGVDADTDRGVCLRNDSGRMVLDGVDRLCVFDGDHEKLLVNVLQHTITLAADSSQGSRTHEDGSIFFMCDIDDKNRQAYKNMNNVCVSRYLPPSVALLSQVKGT